MRLLLLLLLATVAVSASRINPCGVNVTEYKNYLDTSVDVPLEKVADIQLAPAPFLFRYRDRFSNTKYAHLPNAISEISVGQWKEMPDGLRIRTVTYQMVFKNPHRSLIPIIETQVSRPSKETQLQVVDYQERMIRLRTSGRVAEKGLNDFEVAVETCVTPGTVHETDVQVDVTSTYHTTAVKELAQQIQETSNYGLTMVYGALGHLLKKMERTHRSDPFEFNLPLNSGNKIISVSTTGVPAQTTQTTATKKVEPVADERGRQMAILGFAVVIILILVAFYYCTQKCTKKLDGPAVQMSELERLQQSVIESVSDETPAQRLIVLEESTSVQELDYEKK